MSKYKHIHIFGASGSGVSTLGKGLAEALSYKWFDSDDFYWEPTDPPYTKATPIDERRHRIKEAADQFENWVISGTLVSWSSEIINDFDLAIYLYCPAEVRVERLKQREGGNFGERIQLGGDMHEEHQKFIEWAAQYDEGYMGGRSKPKHEAWMIELPCKLLKLRSNLPSLELLSQVLKELES